MYFNNVNAVRAAAKNIVTPRGVSRTRIRKPTEGSFIFNLKAMKTELINLTDKELEIFVRKRLGQQDAELCESEKDHLRFNFHAATAKEKENNFHILALFEDIYEAGDHYHSPTVVAYKGALWIGAIFQSVDEMQDYSGWGTVQIMVNVIKRYLIGYEIYNGHANEVPRISPD